MINNVAVVNHRGEKLVMELRNPERSGFLIFNMTGVGPGKANIRTTDIITADGGLYNSSRLPSRNIVLSLRYFATEPVTVEDIRQESYRFFPIKRPLTLTITTDNRVSTIVGYVESNEPVIFSRETHTQISLICPYPYFTSDQITVTNFLGVYPLFEFPFSNESLTEKLIEMGDIWPMNSRSIWYEGDAEIGVLIDIFLRGPVSGLKIYDPSNSENYMLVDSERLIQLTGADLSEGDHVIISTVRGDKFIKLIRQSVEYNILNALNRNAFWFQLQKGDNLFTYTVEAGLTNIDFRITNNTVYEGI